MLGPKQQSADVTTFAPEMEGDLTDRVGDHGFHSDLKRRLCAPTLSQYDACIVETICKANWGMQLSSALWSYPKSPLSTLLSLLVQSLG